MVKNTLKTDLGRVQVSDSAIAEIAASAAMRIPGVAGLGLSSRVEGLAEIFGVKGPLTGVQVEMSAREVAIRLYLIVEFGAEIGELALQVQEAAADAVEKMTGLDVRAVDVIVQGVRVSEKKGK